MLNTKMEALDLLRLFAEAIPYQCISLLSLQRAVLDVISPAAGASDSNIRGLCKSGLPTPETTAAD